VKFAVDLDFHCGFQVFFVRFSVARDIDVPLGSGDIDNRTHHTKNYTFSALVRVVQSKTIGKTWNPHDPIPRRTNKKKNKTTMRKEGLVEM